MAPKMVLTMAAALAICPVAAPSMASPVGRIDAAQVSPTVHIVSFGGWPFPYGYAWDRARACTQYVPVETTDGHTKWQKVWVCKDGRRKVYW